MNLNKKLITDNRKCLHRPYLSENVFLADNDKIVSNEKEEASSLSDFF